MPEIITRLVMSNLRRAQAFDVSLRTANSVDTIAEQFAHTILFEKDDGKRKKKIDDLIEKVVTQAETKIIPQGRTIGEQNAKDIIGKIPGADLSATTASERGAASFRQKLAERTRAKIVKSDIEANGKNLDKSLTKYWLEPGEGTTKDKQARLEKTHEQMEAKRKAYEKDAQLFNEGKVKSRPSKPNLDYVSKFTSDSKQDIRVQARRTGTDAEIAKFSAEGYRKFVWIAPNGISACPDCINRKNASLTIAQWERIGRPGSGQTVCGIHCFCMLIPEETVSYAPSLITRRESVELGPMTDAATLAFLNANRIEKTK